MQLVTRPLLSALAALLLAVALCSAEIISWQPSGPEPQYFVPEGEVVFSFNAPGSDLQLFASNSTPIDPTFDTLVVFVNGTTCRSDCLKSERRERVERFWRESRVVGLQCRHEHHPPERYPSVGSDDHCVATLHKRYAC